MCVHLCDIFFIIIITSISNRINKSAKISRVKEKKYKIFHSSISFICLFFSEVWRKIHAKSLNKSTKTIYLFYQWTELFFIRFFLVRLYSFFLAKKFFVSMPVILLFYFTFYWFWHTIRTILKLYPTVSNSFSSSLYFKG